jgi:succinate-semialdehyde dehydrogenase/glutarate-semialdehyde dehydrogenase
MSAAPPLRVVSPATGELLAEIPAAGPAEVAAAVATARAAGPAWAARPLRERVAARKRWRREVLDDPELPRLLVRESGKPRQEAEGTEILYFCEVTRFVGTAARRALATDRRGTLLFAVRRTDVRHVPLGVVGVVGPWNFPILNNAADALAPLVAGNAVVLKPSEVTPLTSLRMEELWRKAGNPPGVFSVVAGRGDAGAALVDLVDGVMFTGAVATGRKVAARCGERLVPCVTELGGKSPFLVLAGADLPRAAKSAAWSAFFHSGQACIRTERILVVKGVADEFERLFLDNVKALRQEAPDPDGARDHDLGAVTFPRQLEVVSRQIAEAVSKGARVLTGGKRRSDLAGSFFEPTVLSGVTPGMEVFREETFGPLVPILRVEDAEEALRLANDSHLGLNATVWGPPGEARRVAERIESGNVIVNGALVNYLVVSAPLGGDKASGVGVRHGVEGIRAWTRPRAVNVGRSFLGPFDRLLQARLAFPYDRRVLYLLRRAMRLLYRGL